MHICLWTHTYVAGELEIIWDSETELNCRVWICIPSLWTLPFWFLTTWVARCLQTSRFILNLSHVAWGFTCAVPLITKTTAQDRWCEFKKLRALPAISPGAGVGGCHLNPAQELDTALFKYLHAGEERFSPLAPHLAAVLTEETTSSHQSNVSLSWFPTVVFLLRHIYIINSHGIFIVLFIFKPPQVLFLRESGNQVL